MPLTVVFGQYENNPDNIRDDKRELLDLANFLDAKITTGYNFESDVTFPFSAGVFPELELNSPATAKKYLGGDYSVSIRWFDTELKEVEKPHSPGRYGYYAEFTGKNNIVIRRASTLFCTPEDWPVWTEEILAELDYFPVDGIPEKIWQEQKKSISTYAGKIILKSILDHQEGDILMAFLHDTYIKNLKPGPVHTPVIMDGDYHVKLKQKILGVENKYPVLNPPKQSQNPASSLFVIDTIVEGKHVAFRDTMWALCQEWAEKSREPFDMLVAKQGKILFHGAFGQNLRGAYSVQKPTEIASITKLYTGLLFVQFADQGLLKIDDYVGYYLPDFDTIGSNAITLRQCFTHTTGYRGHGSMGGVQNPWLDNSLARWLPYLDVGIEHYYNGMGYNLLGKVMEIVSGKSIFRLMHEYMFDPLELNNTYLDIDLAYGVKSTAYDLAVVGQMLLNKGQYGNLHFFSERTYQNLLPVDLETYFPQVKGKFWGIGITPMNSYIEDETTGKKRPILSDQVMGHGSATASVLRVDPVNNLVITQSRMNGGEYYEEYLTKALLLIEDHLVEK